MRDTELAEIRAQLVALSAVKAPPPKPSLFDRFKPRTTQARSAPYVGGPVAPRPATRPASPAAPIAQAETASPVTDDLPYFPPQPQRRYAFGQRGDAPEEPPLLLAHPVDLATAPEDSGQRRLSNWLSTDQAYELPAYAQERPIRRESDLRIAAELAETPYAPEDLVEDVEDVVVPAEAVAAPVLDPALADDLARARAAVEQIGDIVRADAAAPRVAKPRPAPRRASKNTATLPAADRPPTVAAGVLDRLHRALLTEQQQVEAALFALSAPTVLAA